ncbi:hypothetical protein D3C83_326150 [compost metagenome]
MFTRAPSGFCGKSVLSWLTGTSTTSKRFPVAPFTVRLVPSTATEPFGARNGAR